MLLKNNDNKFQSSKILKNMLFGKPIHRIGLFVCLAIFFVNGILLGLFYHHVNKWFIIFPISSIVNILLVFWYTMSIRKQLKNIYEYTKTCEKNEETLNQLVYYDSLTGLPNRKMILNEVENILKEGYINKFYLIYFDMDDFRKINETAGYNIGDEVLRYVSDKWSGIKNDKDILGHMGGDEFSLLIKRDIDRQSLLKYIEEFRTILDNPIVINGKEYFISASFGVSEYPDDGLDAIELLKGSFIAMNTAKKLGKNFIQFYTYDMQLNILKRLQIENGLLHSIRNNELYMVYQPIYHCNTMALYGFEALARWEFPGIGHISPAQFIPIAEETGLLVDIGKWIISTVLTKFMEIQRKYRVRTIVSINISIVQMIEPSFVQMIKDTLEETGFDSRYLELEITESVLISYPEHIIEIIGQLKAMGIRIALDDFGTGYASLNYLHMLPINILKIDKSFIDKINKEESMNQILTYIINLAHQLGAEVVAEGVEHEEQLRFLKEIGCDYIQGFLLSKPLKEDHVPKQLQLYQNKWSCYKTTYKGFITAPL